MRKKIVFSACLAALIWFTAGSARASMASELAYTKGLSHVQDKEWNEAVSEFRAVKEKDPEWEDAQYYLGMCYNQLNQYEKASRVLKNLLQTNPDQAEARRELAYTLSQTGKEDEAGQELAKAGEAGAAPRPGRDGKYEIEKERFIRAQAATGTQYDSNVILAPSDSTLSRNISNEWGLRQNFLGFVEVAPWILKELQVGGNYTFFHSLNFNFSRFMEDQSYKPSDYNLQDHRIGIFGTYGYGQFFFNLPYTLDIMLKGGGLDHYWTGNSLIPSVVYPVTSFLYLKGYFRFRNDNFNGSSVDSRRNQDANNVAFGAEPSLLFSGGKKGYLTLSYWLDINRAAGSDWDYVGNLLKADLKYKIFSHFIALGTALQFRNFGNANSLSTGNDSRTDKEFNLGASLGREGKLLQYSLGLSYTINSSNIQMFTYQRLIGSLNLGFGI